MQKENKKLRTAIVHEWLTFYAGSEKCVESFTNIWKDADVFVLFDFMNSIDRKKVIKDILPHTSFLQKFPGAKKHYRNLLPFFPYAIEQFDLSGYDLIISSSHAVAKGVLTNSNQLHINYCHTPMRYAWDLYHQYLNESNLKNGLKGLFAKIFLHYIRLWDIAAAHRVDYFIANSTYISRRIHKVYRRNSTVIHPPVDTEKFPCCFEKDDYFLTASRFVPYKKIDVIVEAFSQMTDKKLIVIGEGPDELKIKSKAAGNITFLGYQSDERLSEYLQKAKAFVFAAEEDFGIMVVEALSCGTPVIAFNKGGITDTIIEGQTGILFTEQTTASIKHAVNRFEKNSGKFIPSELNDYAKKFDRQNFETNIKNFVDNKCNEFFNP